MLNLKNDERAFTGNIGSILAMIIILCVIVFALWYFIQMNGGISSFSFDVGQYMVDAAAGIVGGSVTGLWKVGTDAGQKSYNLASRGWAAYSKPFRKLGWLK